MNFQYLLEHLDEATRKGKAAKYEYGAASVGVLMGIFFSTWLVFQMVQVGRISAAVFVVWSVLKCWFLKSDPVMKYILNLMKQLLHLLESSYQSWQKFLLFWRPTGSVLAWLERSFFLQTTVPHYSSSPWPWMVFCLAQTGLTQQKSSSVQHLSVDGQ